MRIIKPGVVIVKLKFTMHLSAVAISTVFDEDDQFEPTGHSHSMCSAAGRGPRDYLVKSTSRPGSKAIEDGSGYRYNAGK